MHTERIRAASGHVYRVERQRGPQWYVKFRPPNGGQIQQRLGPAWTGRGRPPAGYFTRQTAERELRRILTEAERGTLAGIKKTGATVADAAAEWLRHREQERALKPSTIDGYKSTVRAYIEGTPFGATPLERVTTETIERWRAQVLTDGKRHPRTINRILTELHGIFARAQKVWKLPTNPVADVEPLGVPDDEPLDFYSPEEVWSLVRAAESDQDGAIFLTASFGGLRLGELVALRVRDVDFEAETIRVLRNFTHGALGSPKSGKGRPVPMAPPVATTLAKLLQRDRFTGPDDLVFPGVTGEFLDVSALRRRYKAARARATLRPIRFHDLRHVFASNVIRTADPVEVKTWAGHGNLSTTERYLHYKTRTDAARRIADAFRVEEPEEIISEAAESAAAS